MHSKCLFVKHGMQKSFCIPECLFTVLPNVRCSLSNLSHSRARLLKSSWSITVPCPSPEEDVCNSSAAPFDTSKRHPRNP